MIEASIFTDNTLKEIKKNISRIHLLQMILDMSKTTKSKYTIL